MRALRSHHFSYVDALMTPLSCLLRRGPDGVRRTSAWGAQTGWYLRGRWADCAPPSALCLAGQQVFVADHLSAPSPNLFFPTAQITPFREVDISGPNAVSMRRFNHLHAKMRVVIENCFGRLKGRWSVLRFIAAHPVLAAAVQEVSVALHIFFGGQEWCVRGGVG